MNGIDFRRCAQFNFTCLILFNRQNTHVCIMDCMSVLYTFPADSDQNINVGTLYSLELFKRVHNLLRKMASFPNTVFFSFCKSYQMPQ